MKTKKEQGQALVTLLVFASAATIIIGAAVVMTVVNSQAVSSLVEGDKAFQIAEAGTENALLKLLRDPNYAGETMNINDGFATITVIGSSNKTILSEGTKGSFRRKIQVVGSFNNGTFSVTTWQEVK